jgi:hypothetical protein
MASKKERILRELLELIEEARELVNKASRRRRFFRSSAASISSHSHQERGEGRTFCHPSSTRPPTPASEGSQLAR